MIRVLLFFALLFVVALGFAWMADLPGVISVSWQGYVWEQPPAVAVVVLSVLLGIFLAIVWAIRVVMNSPKIASRFFKRRRKDKGYEALSHGLIALGTGNAKLARRYALDAEKLLPKEPAARLLLAQTAQLAGKDEEARGRFEAMLDDPQTRALGLHGLFVEAERQGEPVAARHYAEEAVREVPGLEWAGKAVLGYQAVAGDWETALKSLERNYTSKLIDKKSYRRQRAVLLTASAAVLEDQDPERAFVQAKEAHGLAPSLVPAAVLASRLATRRGDIRKASKVIEATWKLSPHPDLAQTYAHVRTGDSAVDRLKRVKVLAGLRSNTSIGALVIARAAMEAREFDEAREQLKKVLRAEPTRSAFVMMAELEELEHGDRGRMRDWLARAVHAPSDMAWVADGIVSNEWHAVSPVTGRLDAFEWTTPPSAPDKGPALTLEDGLFEPPLPVVPAPLTGSPAAFAEAEELQPGADPQSHQQSAGAAPLDEVGPQKAAAGENSPAELPKSPAKTPAKSPAKSPAKTPASDQIAAASTPVSPSQSDPDEPPARPSSIAPSPAPLSRTGVEGTVDDYKSAPAITALPDYPDNPSAAPPAAPAGPGRVPSGEGHSADRGPGTGDRSNGFHAASPATGRSHEAPPRGAATQDAASAEAPENGPSGRDDTKQLPYVLGRMPDDPGPEDETAGAPKARTGFFN
ncbi:hypothetical protein GCM10011316_07300 [Roseibium aquae]|uniref:HemY N-terminal domain-containing protein n=1 Tax=Roseibium aquae TaxID=1323746 RepID=A0A916TAA3_9HYPH|nr:heme biosynthesis HemY N-terminal domain-containing protein [Roseibium aquae]GGB37769.1 hypothetical protein GCM10011316_07300 [Roseibium aquae]